MTFRQFLTARHGSTDDTLLDAKRRAPIFEPTTKRRGDLVLHSRGWSKAA